MRRNICKLLALASIVSVAATASYGTVYFQNTGVKSGWNSTTGEHNGSTSEVTSPTYKGSKALRHRQIYDSSYSGRYHSEAMKKDMKKRGWSRYYGFVFRVPSNWQTVNQRFNIQQFIANIGCSSWEPTTMTWIKGNKISTRKKTSSSGKCNGSATNWNDLASFSKGVWHAVIIRGVWKSDSTGTFKFWFDYSKKLERFNTKTTLPTDTKFQFRIGNYANDWHDKGFMEGTQGTRDIFTDHVRVTSSWNEVKPNAW